MGGAGAKDRRRLQRQTRPDPQASTTRTSGHSSRSTAQAPRAVATATVVGSTRTTTSSPPATTKAVVSKKPKHLKRKLEAASKSDLDVTSTNVLGGTHADLLQQMEQWQSAKVSYLQKKRSKAEAKSRRPKQAVKSRREDTHVAVEAGNAFVRDTFKTAGGERGSVRGGRRTRGVRLHPSSNQDWKAKSRDGEGIGFHEVTGPKRSEASTKDQVTVVTESKIRRQGDEPSEEAPSNVDVVESRSVDDDDDDSAVDDDGSVAPKRQRGQRRRRRGRTKNDAEDHCSLDEATGADKEPVPVGSETTYPEKHVSTQAAPIEESTSALDVEETIRSTKKKRKKNDADRDDDRYCVGRKPVTDFVVGQSYTGTIVYVKPFGVFVDIGCHSDAFCHVSRLADDYVDDPSAAFHPGDVVNSVRVVEIDRNRKRITVSFQSESKRLDEQQSIVARHERQTKRPRKEVAGSSRRRHTKSHESAGGAAQRSRPAVPISTKSQDLASSSSSSSAAAAAATQSSQPRPPPAPPSAADSTLTPQQQLKRARKLERRAARRAETLASTAQ